MQSGAERRYLRGLFSDYALPGLPSFRPVGLRLGCWEKITWDHPDERPRVQNDDDGWLFGPNLMSAGSLHSDEWTGPAVNLLTRNLICIKPVGGWWYNRANADVRAQKTRYSLVLSLRADDSEVDLHTPVSNMIEAELGVEAVVIPTRPPH